MTATTGLQPDRSAILGFHFHYLFHILRTHPYCNTRSWLGLGAFSAAAV